MRVAIRLLFHADVRLPRDEVRRQPPYVGELTVQKYFSWHQQEVAPVCASLYPLQIPELERARILYFRGRNLVLHGHEHIAGQRFEQMWWCRLSLRPPRTTA